MRDHLLHRLKLLMLSEGARFVMAGVLNTAFGYTLYLIGLEAGLAPEIALGLSVLVGAIFNYMTTARYVFRHASINLLPRFLLTYGIIYLANVLALRGMLSFGVSAWLAQAILLPAAAGSSYLAFKHLVFRKPD